ncbi:SRPBCC family protein [Streptomyces sp. NBC_01171]|uniref:SRPBCC family protein n=1 Tax=Streptomyces sp. NBC_01171 TaxID=2903757 RepID=UPI003866650D|nr:SRPBCC domain-containing protein [Streptomyces sp. NBC_01171]
MELQVFVPVPADRLREALADAVRVARAVPGLQQDAGAEPVAGRLKLRVGGHSVTYRGTLAVSTRADGTYAVRADGTESRGAGTVTLSLTLTLAPAESGTTVTVGGTAQAEGRLAELPADAVTTAANRLLTRTLETLAAGASEGAGPGQAEGASESTEPEEAEAEAAGPGQRAEAEDEKPESGQQAEAGDEKPATPPPSVFDTEVPPPSLDPETDAAIPDTVPDGLEVRAEPPAEAAHARRTMIGRSAEEVDHAPPRGRYAPVPAPQTVTANPALRWAAPAAAVAVASAIVVARALRKRH